MSATLYIFSGLPGTGKSTLAAGLAQHLGAVFLRIDTIEQALRDLCATEVEGEGYRLAYRVARDNLGVGLSVVADACNPIDLTRSEWMDVAAGAGLPFVNIEVVCTDAVEHRHRIESREVGVPGLVLPTWADVQAREYERWAEPVIRLDTAGESAADSLQRLITMLEAGAE